MVDEFHGGIITPPEEPQKVEQSAPAPQQAIESTPRTPPTEPPIEATPAPVQAPTVEPQQPVEDSDYRDTQEEEQQEEAAFEAAMEMLLGGQGVEQILGGGAFAQLPEHVKQRIRARLQQAQAQREMQQHEMAQQTRAQSQEKTGIAKLFSMSVLGGIISQTTMEKINALFTQQPHLQQQIQLQGQTLIQAGTQPDIEFAKSSVQIAGASPATPQVQQDVDIGPQR